MAIVPWGATGGINTSQAQIAPCCACMRFLSVMEFPPAREAVPVVPGTAATRNAESEKKNGPRLLAGPLAFWLPAVARIRDLRINSSALNSLAGSKAQF